MSASVQGGQGFLDVAKQKRRMFLPRGGVARQDVKEAADADLSSNSRKDSDAWVVYEETKKRSGRRRQEEKGSRTGKDKAKRDGLTVNRFKRLTGFGIGDLSAKASIISHRGARYAACF